MKSLKKKKNNKPTNELPVTTLGAMLVIAMLIALMTQRTHQTSVVDVSLAQLQSRLSELASQHAAAANRALIDQQLPIDNVTKTFSLGDFKLQEDGALTNDSILKLQTRLAKQIPGLINSRVVEKDGNDLIAPPDSVRRQLSFIELDLFHNATNGKAKTPDFIKIDEQWRLIGASQIPGTDDNPLVLMVTYSATPLFNQLENLNRDLAQTALSIEVGRQAIPVFTYGIGGTNHRESKPFADHFQVQLTASRKLVLDTQVSPFILFGLSALAAIILLPATYFLMARYDPVRQRALLTEEQQAFKDQTIKSVTDTDISEEEINETLGLTEEAPTASASDDEDPLDVVASELPDDFPHEIFRDYDIRGRVPDQLTAELSRDIGRAIGSEIVFSSKPLAYVGRDGRLHSEELYNALIDGMKSVGCSVVELGMTPTPMLYFALSELAETASGVMVTASHNSKEYNGFKVVIDGKTLQGDRLTGLISRIAQNNYTEPSQETTQDTAEDLDTTYIDRIFGDVALAGDIKVVVDGGNGVAGQLAVQLLNELGCETIPLFCDIDGNFPNHAPDPTKADNLQPLIAEVKNSGADLGIALDGDGDRLVIVTPSGDIIWPDRLLMLFAKDIVTRNPGSDVVFDVKSTRLLNSFITDYGGRPIMWKAGHANMKAKMRESGAILGGEYSGHIYIKERWHGMDDGIYAAARLLEIITLRDQPVDDIFASIETMVSTDEIVVPVSDQQKFTVIKQLFDQGEFPDGRIIDIDGLRVEFAESWGLVRASNTNPALTLRFEGETEDNVTQIKALFKQELLKVDPSLSLPF